MSERVSRKIIVFGSPKTYGQFFDPNIQIFPTTEIVSRPWSAIFRKYQNTYTDKRL
ncbi:MAG: hypothetical protein ACOVO2_03995 [Emticicia sp.]|uniref:hypothetical protein n=1 Tax=Emticicia sp. TaxID=1930953 RepID=UPI003BA4418D